MAETTISAKLEIQFEKATQKLSDLKGKLSDANAELKKAEKEFGFWSEQAVNAAGKVSKIENAIEKVNAVLKKFEVSGETAFKAFTEAGDKLKTGLGALSGLMELFGEKSGAVEDALKKVSAVMEFSENIKKIKEAGEAFQEFGGVVKDIATKGFGAIKAAIIETGIGALVIVLTTLVSKFIDWVSGAQEAKNAQDKLKASVDSLNSSLKQKQATIENESKLAIAKAKSVGASEAEIYKIQQDYANKNKEAIAQKLRDEFKALEEAKALRHGDEESVKKYNEAMQDYMNTYNEFNKADTDIKLAEYNRKAQIREENENKEREAEDRKKQAREKKINDDKDEFQRQLEEQINYNKDKEALEIAKAQLSGATEKQIFDIQQKYRQKNIDEMRKYTENLNTIKGIDQKIIIDAHQQIINSTNEMTVATINEQTRQKNEVTQIVTEENNKLVKLAEDDKVAKLKQIQDGGIAIINHELEIETERIKNLKISQDEKEKLIKQYTDRAQAAVEGINKKAKKDKENKDDALNTEFDDDKKNSKLDSHTLQYNSQLEALKKWHKDKLEAVGKNDKLVEKLEEETTRRRKAIAKEEFDYKLGLTSDLLNQAADLLGKNTVAGKVAAIASATINTYLGATKALATLPPPFSYIQAAVTVATGIKNIQSIINTEVPGQTSGGSAPSSASTVDAPLTPQVQQTNTTLNQEQLNQIGNATVRAFVVESDVSSNQEKISRLNRAARLGG